MIMLKQLFTLTLLLVFITTTIAQISPPVSWENQTHDFGTVRKGSLYSALFTFTNIGDRAILVDNVRTTCRCIIPYWEDALIEPQEQGTVEIIFSVTDVGLYNKGILVTFRDYKNAEILQITATTDNIEYELLSRKTEEEQKDIDPDEMDLPKINNDNISATPPGMRKKKDVSNMVPGQPNRRRPKDTPEAKTDVPAELPSQYEASEDKRQSHDVYKYMTIREKAMIDEINLLRKNPSGYVPFIQEYIQSMETEIEADAAMATMYQDEISSAYELIEVLNVTDPLSFLKPHEGVYVAAKLHGNDMISSKKFTHVGSDGSYPWDRIIKAAPDLSDGNENLVGGPYEIRQSVIILLVDSGIPDRGHRKTLLNPHWNFVACREIGQVGDMPNSWIQNFAKK